jgi:NADH-quinone oxidoreductase subunit C
MIPSEAAQMPDVAALLEWDAQAVADAKVDRGELTLMIDRERILPVCEFLKLRRGYSFLSDVTAVDWYPSEPRFEVVYHLRCYERKAWLRLKCKVPGDQPEIATISPLWGSATACEREVFDLFGIRFANHPHLTRILLPEDWEGHPLRKDYPVTGSRE